MLREVSQKDKHHVLSLTYVESAFKFTHISVCGVCVYSMVYVYRVCIRGVCGMMCVYMYVYMVCVCICVCTVWYMHIEYV